MKTAIVLVGHLRTFRQTLGTWQSLRRFLSADAFVFTWSLLDFAEPTWWRGGVTPSRVTDDDLQFIRHELQPVDLRVYDARPPAAYDLCDGNRCHPGSYETYWWLCRTALRCVADYDFVIKSRPDVLPERFDVTPYRETVLTHCVRGNRDSCDITFCGPGATLLAAVPEFPQAVHQTPRWRQQFIPETCFALHCHRAGIERRQSDLI